ncbi:hypothetical protein QBC38DRAFT_503395 [Podospora fimiseda]|uniref:Nephrocystin 3-like N-terminal domain-containing protein n=1 Tax=Podospora fimiseda TaxID=252190 RepID=A0AAN7BGW6_9PEZI|nr:hypothetical protein QBC38DRAFT_503395 [Podospora fimiseda]
MATITKHRPIPSTPWFFEWIFDSLQYRLWKEAKTPTRLLRLVGGTGSGKTSFATLAVKRLEQQDNDSNPHSQKPSIVLSVFLKSKEDTQSPAAAVTQEQNNDLFSVQFLAEIERQLDVALKLDNIPTPPTSPQDQTSEAILSSIGFKLHRFSDVYLVVDDLDSLWILPKEYIKVEHHLEVLRSQGVRVLITSRSTFQLPTVVTICDVNLAGDDDLDSESYDEQPAEQTHWHDEENDTLDGLVTWWSCDHPDHDEGPFVICSPCKSAGFTCGNTSHPPPMFTPIPRPITLDLATVPPDDLASFIVHHLQLEHGHFWDMPLDPSPFDPHDLAAPKRIYPPLSPLGKRLLSSIPDQPSDDANDLVSKVKELSGHNITDALHRLELVHQAESLDDIKHARDRLPSNIVDMFTGIFERQIQSRLEGDFGQEVKMRAALALHTIRIVGNCQGTECNDDDEEEEDEVCDDGVLAFKLLKKRLMQEDKKCGHGFTEILEGKYGLDELLGAAGGLLVINTDMNQRVSFFSPSFYQYVKERYNEFLAGKECGSRSR